VSARPLRAGAFCRNPEAAFFAAEGSPAFLLQKEKANLISQTGLYLCRQLEAPRRRERASLRAEPSAEILSVLCEGSAVRLSPLFPQQHADSEDRQGEQIPD